ncbi:MAG: hypothetical protein PHU85_09080 [Phycisphaerae bacterium]|nr:hypothetical protein [Phycisphaerae bacterium]
MSDLYSVDGVNWSGLVTGLENNQVLSYSVIATAGEAESAASEPAEADLSVTSFADDFNTARSPSSAGDYLGIRWAEPPEDIPATIVDGEVQTYVWTEEYVQNESGTGDLAVVGQYEIQARVRYDNLPNNSANWPYLGTYLLARVDGTTDRPQGVQLLLARTLLSTGFTLTLNDCYNGPQRTVATVDILASTLNQDGWLTLKLSVNGDRFTAYIDGVEQFSALDGYGRLADVGVGEYDGYVGTAVGWGTALEESETRRPVLDDFVLTAVPQPENATSVPATSGLKITTAANGDLNLSWTNNAANAEGSQIWGTSEWGNWVLIKSCPGVGSTTCMISSADALYASYVVTEYSLDDYWSSDLYLTDPNAASQPQETPDKTPHPASAPTTAPAEPKEHWKTVGAATVESKLFTPIVTDSIVKNDYTLVFGMRGLLNDAAKGVSKGEYSWVFNWEVSYFNSATHTQEASLNQWAEDTTTISAEWLEPRVLPGEKHPDNAPATVKPQPKRHSNRRPVESKELGKGVRWPDLPGRDLPGKSQTKECIIEFSLDFYNPNGDFIQSAILKLRMKATADMKGKVDSSTFEYELTDGTNARPLNP